MQCKLPAHAEPLLRSANGGTSYGIYEKRNCQSHNTLLFCSLYSLSIFSHPNYNTVPIMYRPVDRIIKITRASRHGQIMYYGMCAYQPNRNPQMHRPNATDSKRKQQKHHDVAGRSNRTYGTASCEHINQRPRQQGRDQRSIVPNRSR